MYACRVKDLRPGQMIDLEGDIIADFHRDNGGYKLEYSTVERVEVDGGSDYAVVYLLDGTYITFPPNHLVRNTGKINSEFKDRSGHLAWDADDVEHHN